MRKDRRNWNRTLLLGGMLLLAAAAVATFWTTFWSDGAAKRPFADRVVVVDAPTAPVSKPVLPGAAIPARAIERGTSPALMATRIGQAYPMLSDVALECEVDQCKLRGVIRPPTGQADLDKRQEMLLGGLATVVAANGYRLVVPFEMDEVDDNTFIINASLIHLPGRSG